MSIWFASLLAVAASATPAAPAETPDQVATRYGLAGELLVGKGDNISLHRAYGTIDPKGGQRHRVGERWRLASITKQASAVMAMRMAERGQLSLDKSLEAKFGPSLRGITPRMLLQHHSELANPDSTPAATGEMPAFYRQARADLHYCLSKPGTPDAPFAYNNCDYLLLGEMFESDGDDAGELDNAFWPGEFGGKTISGFVAGKPEPAFNLATFGTAGSLTGTARDLFAFDRSLMTGKLLSSASLAELWRPEGNGSYQALGQWVFPGKLKGCAAPKRIVQRDGEIGGVQARNFILPDDGITVIVFTNRSSDDFVIGEVWQGKGFAFDLLSAAACP